MAITRPVTRTIISTVAFGIPVADAINGLVVPSVQFLNIPAITVAAGANTVIFDRTYTVGPNVKGLSVTVVGGTSSAGVGDLLLADATNTRGNAAIAPLNNASTTTIGICRTISGQVRVRVNIYAWGGATIAVDGTKSALLIAPVGNIIEPTGTAFP